MDEERITITLDGLGDITATKGELEEIKERKLI